MISNSIVTFKVNHETNCSENKPHLYLTQMRSSPFYILFVLCLDACIERAEFASTQDKPVEIVVDGVITDEPGPYSIKLSRTIQVGSTIGGLTVSNAKITLFSNAGESELLNETNLAGTYKTSESGMRGVIGREYWIEIKLPDGRIFESLPDKMSPTGQVDRVYYKFETFVAENGRKSYGFRIFIDASIPQAKESFTRFRFDGVYAVMTIPKLHAAPPPTTPCPTYPLPCSGWEYYKGQLVSFGPCTCCECWANQFEKKPTVLENNIASRVVGLQVGFVPVNYYTFQNKYRVTVTQLSLSKKAFEYWKTIKDQKDGATSLFQPAFGKTTSNNFKPTAEGKVVGIFYAAAANRKRIFINKGTNNADQLAEVPRDCAGRDGPAGENCLLFFPGSTNQKPPDWD